MFSEERTSILEPRMENLFLGAESEKLRMRGVIVARGGVGGYGFVVDIMEKGVRGFKDNPSEFDGRLESGCYWCLEMCPMGQK